MLKCSLSLSLASIAVVLAFGRLAVAQSAPPLAGKTQGSERWVILLRDRGFDLAGHLQAVRSAPSHLVKQGLLAQLEQAAQLDQQAVTAQVIAAGGVVEKHFWAINALAVDIPGSSMPMLASHPRVIRMDPVQARYPAWIGSPGSGSEWGVLPPTGIATTMDGNNHWVAQARSLLTTHANAQVAKGQGAVWALMDTGVDEDSDGTTPGIQHHPSFMNSANTSTRILAHLRVGTIDCNNIWRLGSGGGYGAPSPGATFGYSGALHSTSAMHGTAMASIAVGRDYLHFGEGHAPLAAIVDVSIAVPISDPAFSGQPWQNRWSSTDVEMLSAVQQLRAFIAGGTKIDVLNIAFGGPPDPSHPVSLALDALAFEEDVLLVTSAGNEMDETGSSHGFYNGLATGAVHSRIDASFAFGSQFPFVAMRETSRGPLKSDWRRYYPDVSATGAGASVAYQQPVFIGANLNQGWVDVQIETPMIDIYDPSALLGTMASFPFGAPVPAGSTRYGRGTSQACAQVSGAAALYRAARKHFAPGSGATAQETRAALLISTIGGAQGGYTANPMEAPGGDQGAYSSRNTVGVGYVRADLLAEFAVRTVSNTINAMHSVVTLDEGSSTNAVSYGGLVPGSRYVVAACWPRKTLDSDAVLVDVSLSISAGGVLIARSAAPANSYERIAFTCPSGTSSVSISVEVDDLGLQAPMPVDIVARVFHPDRDPALVGTQETPVVAASGIIEVESAGDSCVGAARSLLPFRTVPQAYAAAYGSGGAANPLRLINGGNSAPWGSSMHFVFHPDQMGGAATIGGIAMRTWRPFEVVPGGSGSGVVITGMRLKHEPAALVTQVELDKPAGLGATDVLSAHPGGISIWPAATYVDWVPMSFDEYPVVIPFDVPFAYNGVDNLHIWMQLPPLRSIQVDAAANGLAWPVVGSAWQQASNSVYRVGSGPILALLPAPAPMSGIKPRLSVFGEPIVGRSLQVQVADAPANTLVALIFGAWSPGLLHLSNGCVQHIDQPFFTSNAVLDHAGFARWHVDLPIEVSWVHSNAIAMQAAVFGTSPPLLTNAVRAVLGGGL